MSAVLVAVSDGGVDGAALAESFLSVFLIGVLTMGTIGALSDAEGNDRIADTLNYPAIRSNRSQLSCRRKCSNQLQRLSRHFLPDLNHQSVVWNC